VGINVTNFKVLAWCVGCFFAGIAGAFYAHFIKTLTPDSFGVLQAIYVIVYMVVGGRRRFYGAILGAFILTLLPEFFRILKLVITFFLPGGLADLPKLGASMFRRLKGPSVIHA
jgi:branched-chain amino acid transport system permease protein